MSAYTQAQSKARAVAGSVAADSLKATRKALKEWADSMAEQLAAMPEGVLKNQLERSREVVLSQSAKLGKVLIEAVTEGRDASFEEVLGVWQDAAERIARLEGAPAALLGGVLSPGLTLKGAYDGLGGGASKWKTLLTGHVQNAAAEADALVQAALLKGESPMVLARKLRKYVQGAQDLQALGIDPSDLRGIPQSARGAAKRMTYNAERIAFSEIHNARAEAELQHFAADPLIYAVRWKTSSNRGKTSPPDICDALAKNDFFGLGPGVYPLDRVPLPPHPFDRCERFPLVREVETLEDWYKPKPLGLNRVLKSEHANVSHGHDLTASAADRIRTQLDNLFEASSKKNLISTLGAYSPKIPLTEAKAGDSVGLKLAGDPADTFFGEQIGGQGGSNEGALWMGKDGVKRYIKHYKDASQAHGEVIANEIYRRLGLGAPKATTFTHKGKLWYASEIIEGVTEAAQLGKLGLTEARALKALDGFAADVLTANWDAPGLVLDNMVEIGGKVYRIDNGSAFLFRAAGGRKPVSALNKVTEWTGFAPGPGNKNPSYAKLFKAAGLDGPDALGKGVATQIEQVLKLRDDLGPQGWRGLIDQLAPQLAAADRATMAEMLEARTKWLEAKLKDLKGAPPLVKAPELPKVPSPVKMSAAEKKEGSKFAQKVGKTNGKYDPEKYKKANAAYQEAYSTGLGKEAAEQAALAAAQKAPPVFVPPVAPPVVAPAPVAKPLAWQNALADLQEGMTAKPLAEKYTTEQLSQAMDQFQAGSPPWNKLYSAKKYHLDGKVVPPLATPIKAKEASGIPAFTPAQAIKDDLVGGMTAKPLSEKYTPEQLDQALAELPTGSKDWTKVYNAKKYKVASASAAPPAPVTAPDPFAAVNLEGKAPAMAKYNVQANLKDAGVKAKLAEQAGDAAKLVLQSGGTVEQALAEAKAVVNGVPAPAPISKVAAIKADLAQGMTAKPLAEKYTVAELEQAMQDLPTGGKEWTKVYNAKKAKLKVAPTPPPKVKVVQTPAEDWAIKGAAFDAAQGNMTAFKLASKYSEAELQAALATATDANVRATLEAALHKAQATGATPSATVKALFKDLQPGSQSSSVLAVKYDEATLKEAKVLANDFEKKKIDKILEAKKHTANVASFSPGVSNNSKPSPDPEDLLKGREAEREITTRLREYQATLSSAEKSALRYYRGHNYTTVNNHLRFGRGGPANLPKKIANIEKAIANAPALEEDVMLWRGGGAFFDTRAYGITSDAQYQAVVETLAEAHDLGFLSTSASENVADMFMGGKTYQTKFRIKVPKGTKGIWVQEIGNGPNEREFLLQKGTKLKITKVTHGTYWGKPMTLIDAEVVPA